VSLPERLIAAASAGPPPDLIFLSHVFFGTGEITPDLDGLVRSLADLPSFIVIDGYHGYMAIPTNLGGVADRAFYLAGGYKYAMAGEDACFLHAPPGFGARPENTGWFAAFAALADAREDRVGYGADAQRFAGATFDPTGLYRALAVRRRLAAEGLATARVSAHVRPLQDAFAAAIASGGAGRLGEADLLTPISGPERARFLAFRHPDAQRWQAALAAANVITDVRGDVIRFGFGLYHDPDDVDALLGACQRLCL
jgi:selenocysteine lyase/cysteine desulfurase